MESAVRERDTIRLRAEREKMDLKGKKWEGSLWIEKEGFT